MTRNLGTAAGAVVALLCSVAPATAQPAPPPASPGTVTPITRAFADPGRDGLPDRLGQGVLVQGILTGTPRVLGANACQASVQDDSGGVLLFTSDTERLCGKVQRGDRVRVTGTVGHYRGRFQLQVDEIVRLSAGQPPPPRDVTAADLAAGKYSGELVRIRGDFVVEASGLESKEGMRLADDTGTVAIIVSDTMLQSVTFLNRLMHSHGVAVTGIASLDRPRVEAEARYRIVPRDNADFTFGPVIPYREIAVALVLLLLSTVGYFYWKRARLLARHSRQLADAKRAAEAASEAKGRFLANMSHEIRTPMNGVLGMATLLVETPLAASQREYAEGIRTSAAALLRVINDVLDFSKIESGTMQIEHERFDLERTVDDVAQLLFDQAEDKQVSLLVRFSPRVPRWTIGDEGRLRQSLVNLVGNAVKFTERGHVVIDVARAESDQGSRLRVRVTDTGIGIRADMLGRVFEQFEQAEGGTTRRFGGTGLGLAISRRLAELMGGGLTVSSEPGTGSTFTLDLPFTPARTRAGEDVASWRLSTTVLLVDPQPDRCAIVAGILEDLGAVVHQATGPAALTPQAPAHPIEVVMFDEALPRDVMAAWLTAIGPLPSGAPPRVKVSVRPGHAETFHDLAAPNVRFISKPLRRSVVLAALLDRATLSARADDEARGPVALAPVEAAVAERRAIRALVVEDNVINQKVAKRMLETLGCRVDVAVDGREGVARARLQAYDVIFMDCQMPEMDGFEATAAIRAFEGDAARVPIVAMTAHAMSGDCDRCLEAGMDGYLSKPVLVPALRDALERHVRATVRLAS